MTKTIFKVLSIVAIMAASLSVWAQEYDLLIKNGHLIDAKNELDQAMDVAVLDGKVAEVSANIPDEKAKEVIDATGLYVVPGLIDMHVHVFWAPSPMHTSATATQVFRQTDSPSALV